MNLNQTIMVRNVVVRKFRWSSWSVVKFWAGLAAAIFLPVCGYSADPFDSNEVVAMSPFEVSAASVEFEGWKKMVSPNFVVYTDAASTEVRPTIERLEMIFMATQVTIGRRPLVHAPITVVMPSSRSDWKKIRSKGRVKWRVGATSFDEVAYFVVLEYDWQDTGVSLLYTITSNLNLRLLGLDNSFAIGRGLSYFFETAEMHEGALNIGQANSRVGILKYDRWFKWDRFFAINSRSPEYVRDSDDLRRFGAQAAIFVHYMLMQKDPLFKTRLWEWDMLLKVGNKPTEELFQSVFGMDWKELQKEMERYFSTGSFTTRLYRFPPESMKFVVTELAVKTQEMRELFVLTQIHNQRAEESELALASLLNKGLKTADLRSMLASACMRWKRPEAALEILKEMIAEGAQSPEIYGTAVELMLKTNSGDGFPPNDLLEETKTLAVTALEGEPLMANVIENITKIIAMEPEITAEKIEEIKQYCLQLAGNGRTDGALTAFAMAAWRGGDEARAKRICELLQESRLTGKEARTFSGVIGKAIDEGQSLEEMLASLKQPKEK